ncbi:MAG: (d)CMP kinase [Microgenomates group bacterium]
MAGKPIESYSASQQQNKEFISNPVQRNIHEFSEFLKPYDWKIGIDGPAAAGKGSLIELFEKHLGIERLSTGLMYRTVTFALLMDHQMNYQTLSDEQLAEYLQTIDIQFKKDDKENRILLHYHTQTKPEIIDLTSVLELPRINDTVSEVASRTPVREFLAPQQTKRIKESKQIVTEGRDTWLIAPPPITDLLVYIYASDKVLVEREMSRQKKNGITISEAEAYMSIVERNRNDIAKGKLLSPEQARTSHLYSAVIDTTNKTKGETFLQILQTMALHPKVTNPPSLRVRP